MDTAGAQHVTEPADSGPPPTAITEPVAVRELFLAGLERGVQPLDDPAEIMSTVARLVGEQLACDRCAYAEAEADEDHFTMTGSYPRGLPPADRADGDVRLQRRDPAVHAGG